MLDPEACLHEEPISQALDDTSVTESTDNDELIEQANPTDEEAKEVEKRLQGMGVRPNKTVNKTIKEYYGTVVNDAIASMKERQAQGERFGCAAAVFVNACKNGEKPELSTSRSGIPAEINPISPQQLRLLDDAKATGKILDHYPSCDGIYKVVMPGGFVMKPWWEYLGVSSDQA